ncbi:2-5A-dependent ribonuclease-like [Branchiostoma floridae x Branchiostoma belcheri]
MDVAEFLSAVEKGDVQTVRRGLQAGRDVNLRFTRTWNDWTALHVASQNGRTGIVKLLIQHGADVEARDEFGRTALHLASEYGHTGIVELLIQHGADVTAKDKVLFEFSTMCSRFLVSPCVTATSNSVPLNDI